VGTFTAGGPRDAGSEQRPPANPNEENRTVKRTVGIAVGVATVGLAVYLGSHLWAQTGAPAAHPGSASPKTRIALLNLKYVVMNYGKWKQFTEQLKSQYKTYEDRVQALNTKLEGLKAQMQKATDQAQKDQIEKDAKSTQREMQDLADEAKNTLGKKEADELVVIYKEIAAAVSRFAQANDIDLVMHYNDATTDTEMNSPQNIQRKMVTGPCTPLYYKPNEIDISTVVLQMLNQSYQAAGGTVPAAPAH
jgi:Skp family chaperone for outer membrane proteins